MSSRENQVPVACGRHVLAHEEVSCTLLILYLLFLFVTLDLDISPEYIDSDSSGEHIRKSSEHLSYTLSRGPPQGEHQGTCSSAKSEEARAPTLAEPLKFSYGHARTGFFQAEMAHS